MVKALVKRSSKEEREQEVLIGLVDYYISHGKAVGSNTLKDAGFQSLSSATIRNYFASLEEEGYLVQQHTSGGRIPSAKAYRLYADAFKDHNQVSPEFTKKLLSLSESPTREIEAYLQKAAETLSEFTGTAVFLSAPRFDHDFVASVRLVGLDAHRCLCVILSDFGIVRTEIIQSDEKLSAHLIKRIESFFQWRLTGSHHDSPLSSQEEFVLAQKWYNEVMVRYIVGYAHFNEDEIYRTGFSKLLAYSEFEQAAAIAKGLSLFENRTGMRLLLRECLQYDALKWWMDDDLIPYAGSATQCAVIAHPYKLNQTSAGAIGLLGPMRLPYKKLFAILREFCETLSHELTASLHKFKINYRSPERGAYLLKQEEAQLLLLEDQREGDPHD